MINWIDYGIQQIQDSYVIQKETIGYYYLSQKNLVLMREQMMEFK